MSSVSFTWALFTLVFTGKIRLPGFLCLVAGEKFYLQQQRKIDVRILDTYKNIDGPTWDGSECTLRDTAKVTARLLSNTFEKARQSGKDPKAGKRQMSHLSSKKGRKIQITKGQMDSPQSMERYRTSF